MGEINRWTPTARSDEYGLIAGAEMDGDGDYYLADDADAELATREARIRELEWENEKKAGTIVRLGMKNQVAVADRNAMREEQAGKMKYIKKQATELATLTAERDELRGFFEKMANEMWGFDEPDGGDFQDYADQNGLIVQVPADDDTDGDTMWVLSWSPLAKRES